MEYEYTTEQWAVEQILKYQVLGEHPTADKVTEYARKLAVFGVGVSQPQQ